MRNITLLSLLLLLGGSPNVLSDSEIVTKQSSVTSTWDTAFFSGTGHTYVKIPIPKDFFWQTMRDSSLSLGGHLATAETLAENNFIASFANPFFTFLGGTDESSEGNWFWVTGAPIEFTAWGSGEPNNHFGGENYVQLLPTDSLWNDGRPWFVDSQVFIVEFGCCIGSSGNIDNDPTDIVDISDLTMLIDHLFISFPPLACPGEGNVDGDEKHRVDIADLTALIDHLFINFPPTAACQ